MKFLDEEGLNRLLELESLIENANNHNRIKLAKRFEKQFLIRLERIALRSNKSEDYVYQEYIAFKNYRNVYKNERL